jgi:hypothetical protein
MSPTQSFSRDAYYTWFTPSSPLSTILGGVAMIIVMLAGVMFPLWPPKLRLGVYYLSIGVLGLIGVFIAIAIVRLILWMVTSLVLRKGIWWFPNLFEDVGFVSLLFPFSHSVPPASFTHHPRRSCVLLWPWPLDPGRLVHPILGMGRTSPEKGEEIQVRRQDLQIEQIFRR